MDGSVATLKNSKTLDGPLKNPRNPQVKFVKILRKNRTFPGKNRTFSRKNRTFWEKSGFCRQKFLMTFFSHQLSFSNFSPLTDQKLKKQQLVPYFLTKKHLLSSKKHSKICIFRGNLTKPQKNPSFFEKPQEKTLGLQEKTQNPRSGRKTPDLGRKP